MLPAPFAGVAYRRKVSVTSGGLFLLSCCCRYITTTFKMAQCNLVEISRYHEEQQNWNNKKKKISLASGLFRQNRRSKCDRETFWQYQYYKPAQKSRKNSGATCFQNVLFSAAIVIPSCCALSFLRRCIPPYNIQ